MDRRRLDTSAQTFNRLDAVQGRAVCGRCSKPIVSRFFCIPATSDKTLFVEGAETLMVALETILHKCPDAVSRRFAWAWRHRGRLNVLANFLRKSLKIIFTEFSENYIPDLVAGDGDVKYHLGYQAVRRFAQATRSRSTLVEPSHLEAVDPVVEGKARARNEFAAIRAPKKVLPLLIHGDAAFIAQESWRKR